MMKVKVDFTQVPEEPHITGPQIDLLDALCDELGIPPLECEGWSRMEASDMIDKLKARKQRERRQNAWWL